MRESVFTPVSVRYEGWDAAHHLIDIRRLSRSLDGIGRLYNSSAYVLMNGELPSTRAAKYPIKIYARPFKEGCFPVDLVTQYGSDELHMLSELAAGVGGEIIQRMISVAMLSPSARSKEIDPHFQRLTELEHFRFILTHSRQRQRSFGTLVV